MLIVYAMKLADASFVHIRSIPYINQGDYHHIIEVEHQLIETDKMLLYALYILMKYYLEHNDYVKSNQIFMQNWLLKYFEKKSLESPFE